MKTLAFYNMKGGVGKTTAAVNFAYLAAQEGIRTLLWDLDPQRSATFHFHITPKVKIKAKDFSPDQQNIERLLKTTNYTNLDLIPATFNIRRLDAVLGNVKKGSEILTKFLQKLAPSYDFLFIDCPAGMSILVQSLFRVTDYLVIPVIPTTLSLQTFQRVQWYLKKKQLNEQLQVISFFSMVDHRKSLHHHIMETKGPEEHFCKAVIPTRSMVEKMGLHQAPLPSFSTDSKATLEFQILWEEIKTRMA